MAYAVERESCHRGGVHENTATACSSISANALIRVFVVAAHQVSKAGLVFLEIQIDRACGAVTLLADDVWRTQTTSIL